MPAAAAVILTVAVIKSFAANDNAHKLARQSNHDLSVGIVIAIVAVVIMVMMLPVMFVMAMVIPAPAMGLGR